MGVFKVAEADQIQPGTMQKFSVDQHMILIANVDGSYYALDNKCPHMGGDLSQGKLVGKTVTCPRHGASFDVTSGESLANAKIAFISMKVGNATAYPVKLEGNDIFVELK